MDDDRRMFVCQICNKFGGNSFGAVLRHIGEIHRHDPNLSIRCGVNRCPQTYESYRSHVYRKHRDVLHGASDTNSNPHVGIPEEEGLDLSYFDEDSCYDEGTMQCDETYRGAKFLLKIREQYRMPQSTLDKVVVDFKGIWTVSQESMRKEVKKKLEDKLCETDVAEIMESFDSSFPLRGLETEYLQLQYYKQHFNYLEPVERVLAQKTLEVNGREKQLSECCYDISLIESLQQLLHMDVVREQIRNTHAMSNGLMGDYCDGLLFSDHELFKDDPAALQIQLYYDELEVCNPLGSKTKKHKLGVVYYTLGNIDPKLRSSLKCIQLLSIAKYEHIHTHGVEELLKPIIKDVLKLEQESGVDFDVNGEIYRLRGTVTVFSADYLAAWTVGGFKALMSAFRKCQFCMVTDAEMQTQFNEAKVMLRTKSIYEAHCRGLDGPLHQHISTTFGMVRNSALNQLNYFHVVKGLVPDIMHNVLEGSLELCTRHLLIQLIYVDKRFPLSLLNSRISSFCYGPDIKNRPSLIYREHLSASGHLRQSASQMWCLGRFLPLLIGDKIPTECPYWDNYVSHLHIMDEIFAPITTED